MKKLLILILCLALFAGCVSVPANTPQGSEATAALAVESTASPVPEDTPEPAPTATSTPAPTATPRPVQTCSGAYFRFDAPKDWLRVDVDGGVYLYPDPNDTDHTCLSYQEVPNDMNLSETMVDIALLFSSKEAITAMVEGALTSSGITGFTLSPVDIEKTKLNGFTCYRGASTVTLEGESYDFVGHIFLQGEKMVLLIWVGDQAAYADALAAVYDSFAAVR